MQSGLVVTRGYIYCISVAITFRVKKFAQMLVFDCSVPGVVFKIPDF